PSVRFPSDPCLWSLRVRCEEEIGMAAARRAVHPAVVPPVLGCHSCHRRHVCASASERRGAAGGVGGGAAPPPPAKEGGRGGGAVKVGMGPGGLRFRDGPSTSRHSACHSGPWWPEDLACVADSSGIRSNGRRVALNGTAWAGRGPGELGGLGDRGGYGAS